MKVFKDKNGKEWTLELTLGACKRVKDLTGFDLLQPEKQWEVKGKEGVKASYYERIEDDPYFILDIIIAACRDSFKQYGYDNISDAEAYELFDGETYQNALKAFREEYEDFFLKIGKSALSKYLKKIDEMESAKNVILEAKLSVLDTKKLLDDSLKETTSGIESTVGQEKLELTSET